MTTTNKKPRWGRNQRYQFQKQEQVQEPEREHLSEREKQAYAVFVELFRRKANNGFLLEAYIKARDRESRTRKEFEANESRIKELQKQYSNLLKYVKEGVVD